MLVVVGYLVGVRSGKKRLKMANTGFIIWVSINNSKRG